MYFNGIRLNVFDLLICNLCFETIFKNRQTFTKIYMYKFQYLYTYQNLQTIIKQFMYINFKPFGWVILALLNANRKTDGPEKNYSCSVLYDNECT